MKPATFTDLLQAPYPFREETCDELADIVRQFPYCQSTRVLLALVMYKRGDPAFATHLRIAAACIPGRKRLKEIFQDPLFAEEKLHESEPGIVADFEPPAPAIMMTKEQIIEKFIMEEPGISRPRSEFFNPNESAVKSSQDDYEIVSETLAQLYYNQGNTPKAIKIYEKLSLHFPGKSRYFAAQIEKLKGN
jgi:hypothetical protein